MEVIAWSEFAGDIGKKVHLDLCYEILEKNIDDAYYKIRLYNMIRSFGVSGGGSTATGYINGEAVGTFTSISKNEYKQVGYKDITVYADDNGKCSFTASARVETRWTIGSTSCDGSRTLEDIPRSSSVTCTDGMIESAVSINISRASGNFKHTIRYDFCGLTGTIATNVDTNVGFTLPSTFYEKIPNSKSAVGTIYCDTYNGDKLLGTKSCTFTVSCNESLCVPSIYATIEDVNPMSLELTGNKDKLIKFVSNVKVVITAIPKNLATIISTAVTCGDGKSSNGNTTFEKIESGEFTISCVDSRGFISSQKITKEIVEYIVLSVNVELTRDQPTNGKVRASISGNYYNGSFGTVNNTLELKYRCKKQTDQNWNEYISIPTTIENNSYSYNGLLSADFDYQTKYDFEVLAIDKLGEKTSAAKLNVGIPVLSLFKYFIELWGKSAFKLVNDKLALSGDIQIGSTGCTLENIANLEYMIASTDISQTASSNYIVNLNVSESQGDFTLENGQIKIGPNISMVEVSGSVIIEDYTPGSYLWAIIRKNGENVCSNLASGSSTFLSGSIPRIILKVKEGDLLSLIADYPVSGAKIWLGKANTFLYVKKIK